MKRLFDLAVSLSLLLLLLPILVIIAVLVRWHFGSPVFFRQRRPGLNGNLFYLVKFRTMLDVCGDGDAPMTDAERLTNFGRFLRYTSLDELPELWNVFRGDMSLVGPRPLLVEYLPLYTSEQARRHDIRPGITGLAQVRGRNALSWEEKFDLDIWYVDNQTFWLDMKILWLTAIKVLKREGISHADDATMPKFTGTGAGT